MLTATDLGISQAEYEALQVVRDGLASGRFVHAELSDGENVEQFDMGITAESNDCGTVACIGGWVGLTMGMARSEADKYVWSAEHGPLKPLYFPNHLRNWDSITPDVAARTITTFLDSGEVDFAVHL